MFGNTMSISSIIDLTRFRFCSKSLYPRPSKDN